MFSSALTCSSFTPVFVKGEFLKMEGFLIYRTSFFLFFKLRRLYSSTKKPISSPYNREKWFYFLILMELSPFLRLYYVWIGDHFGPALCYVYCLHGYFHTFIVREKCVPIKTLFEMRERDWSETEERRKRKRKI